MLRLAGLCALTATSAGAADGTCSGADCAGDAGSLLQLRAAQAGAPEEAFACPGTGGQLSVCPIGDPASRCKFLMPFSLGGGALHDGIAAVSPCLSATPVNETCFSDATYKEYFKQYAQSYSPDGGLHAAFVWPSGSSPATYTKQPDQGLIADYYWQYVGRHSLGFGFPASLTPEPLNGTNAIEKKGCAVANEAPSKKPSYIFFGFDSNDFDYAGGLAILDNEKGTILRQYATGAGRNLSQEGAPGYLQDYSKSFGQGGKVAKTLTEYWSALRKGDTETLSKLYTPDAKVSVYNYLDGKSRAEFEGETAIKSYLEQLVQHFGSTGLSGAESYLQLAEEATSSVPGSGHYTYTVGDSQMGITVVFAPCGRIFGEGVYAAAAGLSLSS